MLPYEAMLSISESAGRGPTVSISTKLEYKAVAIKLKKLSFSSIGEMGKKLNRFWHNADSKSSNFYESLFGIKMIRNLPSLSDDLYRTHTHAQTSARNAHAPSHSPCFTCSLSLSVTRMPTPERNSSSSLTLSDRVSLTHTRTFVLAQAHALAIKSLHVVQRERPNRCSRQRFARSSFFRCCSFGLEKKN